jgi:biotin carboxyl carrier protein
VEGGVTTTMQGMILKLKVTEGDNVKEGMCPLFWKP